MYPTITIIKKDYAKYGSETLETEISFKISLSRATQKCKCRLERAKIGLNSYCIIFIAV